jgi:hypothetical protein
LPRDRRAIEHTIHALRKGSFMDNILVKRKRLFLIGIGMQLFWPDQKGLGLALMVIGGLFDW